MAAAVAAAAVVYIGATLPPRSIALSPDLPPDVRLGAYHIHTARSDGTGSIDEVASAAARAGLAFVVLTDHGDGTRAPEPPSYRQGVLVIDAVEISTFDGHLVALGLPGATPYPLAGHGRDVIDDVHRLGGFAVIAHPDSPKPALRWRAGALPYDGFEWLNADSEWRDEPAGRLVTAFLGGLVRGPEAIASVFNRTGRRIARWDGRQGRQVGLAAHDAHARIGLDEDTGSGGGSGTLLARPSYLDMFRALAQAVELDGPLEGAADADARAVLRALAAGRSYTIVRAFADPGRLEFAAEQPEGTAWMGERLAAGPARARARIPQAPEARLALLLDGRQIADGQGVVTWNGELEPDAALRIEAFYPGHAFPWIVSNPIYGPGQDAIAQPAEATPDGPGPLRAVPSSAGWQIERDPTSTARMEPAGGRLRWTFELGPGHPRGQYTALALPIDDEHGYERVAFEATADRPMRLWVQVRLPGPPTAERWGRSVYLDPTPRRVVVRLEDLEPIGRTTTLRPVVARLRSILFVVDTVNTAPGSRGEVTLSDVALGLGPPDGGRP